MAGPPERGYQRYSLDLRIAYAGDCAGKRSNQARSPAPAGPRPPPGGPSGWDPPFATSTEMSLLTGGASGDARGGCWGGRGPFGLGAACRRRSPAAGPGAIDGEHEVGDARGDLSAEARAVEDAVVAHIRLQPMRLAVGGDIDAQPVR